MTADKDSIAEWTEAAGVSPDHASAVQVVKKVGEFLRNIGNFSDEEVCQRLPCFDYKVAPIVVRLPNSVFVRHEDTDHGMWLTDLGLSVDAVKPLAARATRELLTPIGPVPALRAAPREPLPDLRIDDLVRGVSPSVRAQLQQNAPRSAGQSFCVLGFNQLRTMR